MNTVGRRTVGLTFNNPAKTYAGYTLFTPMHYPGETGQAWLVNMQGEFVHCWNMDNAPGPYGVLLPSGNLLYAGKIPNDFSPGFGGSGGELIEVDWDSNVVWRYEDPFMHHDFYRMPNGNTMTLRWVETPPEIAAKVPGGIPDSEKDGVMWADSLREITPEGEVVWEWLAYEHIDFEADVICPICDRSELSHFNSCQVLPDGNILISMFKQNTIAIIDKETGDYTWKWGPPGELGHPHNPNITDKGTILVFDNGLHRVMSPAKNFILLSSRVLEIDPLTNEIVWEYSGDAKLDFWGPNVSGCQRLPNGNTFICVGPFGRFVEVTPDKELVWEYVSPLHTPFPKNMGLNNATFRAYRYGIDFPGLIGKDLASERYEWVIQRKEELEGLENTIEKRLGRLGY